MRIPQMNQFDVVFYANLAAGAYFLPKLRVQLAEAAGLQLPMDFNEVWRYVVRDEKNKLAVVVFRGTVPTDKMNLQADVDLAMNRQSQQKLYQEAQDYAGKLKAEHSASRSCMMLILLQTAYQSGISSISHAGHAASHPWLLVAWTPHTLAYNSNTYFATFSQGRRNTVCDSMQPPRGNHRQLCMAHSWLLAGTIRLQHQSSMLSRLCCQIVQAT